LLRHNLANKIKKHGRSILDHSEARKRRFTYDAATLAAVSGKKA
jgi:hypothetical protein